MKLLERPRRNRKSAAIRALVQETQLHPSDFVAPFFLCGGENVSEPIENFPGVSRLSRDLILREAEKLHEAGVQAIALFPQIDAALKDETGSQSRNECGLLPQAIRWLKHEIPSLMVIADVALDPYTSHGHDGVVQNGYVENDATVELLCEQALCLADAGVDCVAPSDMMDGRIGAIREALEANSHTNVAILSYAAKYASAFYGPFRSALSSAPSQGDKKSYQMHPANAREALREAALDEKEGADLLMVKPATLYLDVLTKIREKTTLPLGAYHVSGEYAMVAQAAANGVLDLERALEEIYLSIKRAGADFIFSYAYQFIRSI